MHCGGLGKEAHQIKLRNLLAFDTNAILEILGILVVLALILSVHNFTIISFALEDGNK